MTTQISLLPKMGAPLRVLTAAQIATEQKLYGETAYNISHRARVLGVNHSTLAYHLRPVFSGQSRIPMNVQRLIEAGDALLAIAPRNEAAWKTRLAWSEAKAAVTRKKK